MGELSALPSRTAGRTLNSINTATFSSSPECLDSSFYFYLIHSPVLLKSTKHQPGHQQPYYHRLRVSGSCNPIVWMSLCQFCSLSLLPQTMFDSVFSLLSAAETEPRLGLARLASTSAGTQRGGKLLYHGSAHLSLAGCVGDHESDIIKG